MVRSRSWVVVGAVSFALVFAACSNGGSDGSGGSGGQAADGGEPSGMEGAGSGAPTLEVAKGDLGKMLVDDSGRTLYLFLADKGSTSTCESDCAANWPALVVSGQPSAGDGVDASSLGTSTRSDGSTQVTIDGHPLYTFSGDTAAGDTNGQGIGDVWYVASPDGTSITSAGGAYGGKY